MAWREPADVKAARAAELQARFASVSRSSGRSAWRDFLLALMIGLVLSVVVYRSMTRETAERSLTSLPRDMGLGPRTLLSSPPRDCAEARASGAAPILRGTPGYASRLDADGDGVACEFSLHNYF